MILVTGGTGLVGSHLLYFLLKDGKSVRATHRKNSNLAVVKKVFSYYTKENDILFSKIEWVEANLNDIPALTEAFTDVTYVYHVAAYISFNPKHYRKLKKSNIEGTANIVNLCLHHSVKKLAYVSSVAAIGSAHTTRPITENTEWNPELNNSVYAITKYGAEMEVWRGTQEGLDAVIINPSIILGEGFFNEGSGLIIKNGIEGQKYYTSGAMGFVDVQDVVRALIQLQEGNYTNERFIVSAKTLTYKALFEQIASLSKSKPPSILIPKWVLVVLSKLEWFFASIFKFKRQLPRTIVDSMYDTSRYDTSKIETTLKFQFTPMDVTLKRIIKNYQSTR